ncbi:MAG: metallophosphoesterase [Lentisphaeria bacterium]|nr:metallophosphoesterase [Lentisphaeria bacterium]
MKMEAQAIVFIWIIGLIPFLYVLIRAVLPLRIRLGGKLALAALLFAVAFKFQILRRFAGPMFFAPQLPNWILALAAWAFTALCFFLVFLLAADIVRLAVWAVRKMLRRPPLPRGRELNAGANLALLVVSCLLTAWGMSNAVALPEVQKAYIVDRLLPREMEGLRIALLADLHIDKLTDKNDIAEVVRRTNALNPDVIAIAGDFVDGTVAELRDKVAPLAGLRAKYGVYGIPGNHEYYSGYGEWMAHLRSLGIVMLENSNRLLPCKLAVAGITDPTAARFGEAPPDFDRALGNIPKGYCKLLLAHQLKQTPEAVKRGVYLQLSGHTHGGMVVGLDRLVARANLGYVAGWYRVGRMSLYVSPGTYLWKGYPIRLGVPSEITCIDFSLGRLYEEYPRH